MANTYQNFSVPIINQDQEYGWAGLNKNLSEGFGGIGNLLLQQAIAKKQQENELGLAIAKAKAEQGIKQDAANQAFDTNINRLKTNPELFGLPSSPEVNMNPGGSMSEVAPPAFRTLINPMSGQIHQVVNPEYALYRSQQLAKMRNQMQPESTDAASAISYSKSLKQNMDEINNIVNKKDFDWGAFGAWRVSQDNPSFTSFGRNMKQTASGDYEDPRAGDFMKIHNALQFIKKTAFGEGGKQLTDTEKQLVYSVLQPQGMPISEWKKNLVKASATLENKARMLARNKENIDTAISSTEENKSLDAQINQMLDQLGAQ